MASCQVFVQSFFTNFWSRILIQNQVINSDPEHTVVRTRADPDQLETVCG